MASHGKPLMVCFMQWCALCIAGFLYCQISEFMFALNNLDRPMTYERKLLFTEVCMWFCCYCCCVCWFFKSSFGYIFQFCFLQGLDQLRPGILQQQKSFMQSPQSFTQLQLLTPQQQQQLLIQAQQSTTSPAMGDVDSRRLRMLLSGRNMILGKDALSNAVGDVVQNVGSPMQAVCPVLPRSETDMLFKVLFCAIVFSFSCVPWTYIGISFEWLDIHRIDSICSNMIRPWSHYVVNLL